MNAYAWQNRARIVAYVDMVLSVLAIVLAIIIAILFTVGSDKLASQVQKHDTKYSGGKENDDFTHNEVVTTVVIVTWVIVAISILFTFLQMFAAYKLLLSTKQEMDANGARSNAKFWMIVTIVFLILGSVGYISQGNWPAFVVNLIIRGIFIAVVKKWMDELSFASQ